ncbi:MAG: MliC family protein, partial [Candidatus Dactylopiibacterium sp.]|nr:MliC family protein [Candidatus Dactylopiibacterium sp.]
PGSLSGGRGALMTHASLPPPGLAAKSLAGLLALLLTGCLAQTAPDVRRGPATAAPTAACAPLADVASARACPGDAPACDPAVAVDAARPAARPARQTCGAAHAWPARAQEDEAVRRIAEGAPAVGPVALRCDEAAAPVTITFYNTLVPAVAVLHRQGERWLLFAEPAASGIRYGGQGAHYGEHQGQVTIRFADATLHCRVDGR